MVKTAHLNRMIDYITLSVTPMIVKKTYRCNYYCITFKSIPATVTVVSRTNPDKLT